MGWWIDELQCKQNTFPAGDDAASMRMLWAQSAAGMVYKYSTIMTAKSQLYKTASTSHKIRAWIRDGKIATPHGEVLTSGEKVLPERTQGTHTS